METPIVVAIITTFTSIAVAAVSYFFTKLKEREADWRKQKLEHYRELLEGISGTVGSDSTPEGNRRFARAPNVIALVASQKVLNALRDYQDEVRVTNTNKSDERHDKVLVNLLLAIREDLNISPKDDHETFSFKLWCSGTNDKAIDSFSKNIELR